MFVRGLSSLKKGSPARDARRGKRPVLQAPPRHSAADPRACSVEICKTLARRTGDIYGVFTESVNELLSGERTTEFDNGAIFGTEQISANSLRERFHAARAYQMTSNDV